MKAFPISGWALVRCTSLVLCGVLVGLVYASGAWGVLVYRRALEGKVSQPREIIVAGDDGSRPYVIGRGTAPVVSPDGHHVAFFAGLKSDRGLWVVRIDGSHGRRYVRHSDRRTIASTLYDPFRWSPDSRYILGNVGRSCDDAQTPGAARRCGAVMLIRLGRGVLARYRAVDVVDGVAFAPDARRFVLGSIGGGVSSQGANYEGFLYSGSTSRPKVLRHGGIPGEQPAWGKPGLAFLRLDTKSGLGDYTQLDLVAAPGASPRPSPRPLFTREMPNGNRLDVIVGWTAGSGDLLVGLKSVVDSFQAVQPVLIDPRTGAMQYFPQQLMSISAISRDGSTVLGESLQGEVVAVRADGNVKVLASHADSATWTS